MQQSSYPRQKRYIFFLARPNQEAMLIARRHLLELGVKVLSRQGDVALIGMATREQLEAAQATGLFSTVTAEAIKESHLDRFAAEQLEAARLWNTLQSPEYYKLKADKSQEGKSWADPDKEPLPPSTPVDPEDFKRALLEELQIDEEELLERYKEQSKKERPPALEGDEFVKYEKRLADTYEDETIAYHLARLAWHLHPAYRDILFKLPWDFLKRFFLEVACWKMEGEISVGVVFVESSSGSPVFSASDRATLQAEVVAGFDWLASQAPAAANLTWVYDWQFVTINVANGTNSSDEAYWRNPAMGQVNYFGNTYNQNWDAVADYREDMRQRNRSAHAIVVFVTPYATSWHAYASGGRLTLANRNNWGGWGIGTIDRITSHEICHLFGAADEYTGSGTPCSSCATTHGCYNIPNGNCGACARPRQDCVMDANQGRLCAYTQGQIGWADLFVELTTADELWAGTDDDVWLDIGDRTFYLDNPNHDDRERNNVEGYALNYSGVTRNDVKRVGIRKSPDGFAGGWKLQRVRVWVRGELICDENNINQWLEDDHLWWVSAACGTSRDIVNRLQVRVTTADVMWAGTDDDVYIYLGGRGWNLDNPGHNDFERGNTDTFNVDPGASLYRSGLSSIQIHKTPDGLAGGWKLKGLQIYVNGTRIYNNQSINKWLEDNDRDWFGTI